MLEFVLIIIAIISFGLGKFYEMYLTRRNRQMQARAEALMVQVEQMTQAVCECLRIAIEEDRLDFLVSMIEKRPDQYLH